MSSSGSDGQVVLPSRAVAHDMDGYECVAAEVTQVMCLSLVFVIRFLDFPHFAGVLCSQLLRA